MAKLKNGGINLIIYFTPMLHFHASWKHQKTKALMKGAQKWNIGLK